LHVCITTCPFIRVEEALLLFYGVYIPSSDIHAHNIRVGATTVTVVIVSHTHSSNPKDSDECVRLLSISGVCAREGLILFLT
jgi:hypothetical protein